MLLQLWLSASLWSFRMCSSLLLRCGSLEVQVDWKPLGKAGSCFLSEDPWFICQQLEGCIDSILQRANWLLFSNSFKMSKSAKLRWFSHHSLRIYCRWVTASFASFWLDAGRCHFQSKSATLSTWPVIHEVQFQCQEPRARQQKTCVFVASSLPPKKFRGHAALGSGRANRVGLAETFGHRQRQNGAMALHCLVWNYMKLLLIMTENQISGMKFWSLKIWIRSI